MDETLEKILVDLRKLVTIPRGENPLTSTADAFRLAEREDLIWRWEKRGPVYYLRLKADTPTPIIVPEPGINIYLVNLVMLNARARLKAEKATRKRIKPELDVELEQQAIDDTDSAIKELDKPADTVAGFPP